MPQPSRAALPNLQASPFRRFVERWRRCTACPLSKDRQRVVLCRGSVPCDVLFVGEAPGESEDAVGQPFVGPAGRLLDQIVDRAGLNGGQHQVMTSQDCGCGGDNNCPVCDWGLAVCKVCKGGESDLAGTRCKGLRTAFTNLVCCIPRDEEGGKAVEPEEGCIMTCGRRLTEFVGLARPKLIVCVGRLARDHLEQGYKHSVKVPRSVPQVSIDHPAFVLRAHIAQRGLLVQRAIVTIANAVEEYLQ